MSRADALAEVLSAARAAGRMLQADLALVFALRRLGGKAAQAYTRRALQPGILHRPPHGCLRATGNPTRAYLTRRRATGYYQRMINQNDRCHPPRKASAGQANKQKKRSKNVSRRIVGMRPGTDAKPTVARQKAG